MSNPIFDVLRLREGEQFTQSWTFLDDAGDARVWTAGSAAMMVRADVGDAVPSLSLTSSDGIALGSAGLLTVTITKARVAALVGGTFGRRLRGSFALIFTDALGVSTTLAEGFVLVQRSPTR